MMTALKMVWIISRHYNKDERMSLLMQLIAVEIAEKVAKEINIRSIFRRKPEVRSAFYCDGIVLYSHSRMPCAPFDCRRP